MKEARHRDRYYSNSTEMRSSKTSNSQKQSSTALARGWRKGKQGERIQFQLYKMNKSYRANVDHSAYS